MNSLTRKYATSYFVGVSLTKKKVSWHFGIIAAGPSSPLQLTLLPSSIFYSLTFKPAAAATPALHPDHKSIPPASRCQSYKTFLRREENKLERLTVANFST